MTDRTDNFNRAGPGLGSNWTTSENLNALVISASTVVKGGTNGADNAAYWSADTFANDQNSQVAFVSFSDGGGPLVRHQTGASTFYSAYNGGSAVDLSYFEVTAGSFAQLGSAIAITAMTAGQIFKLSVAGSVLTASVNGVDQGTRTDSSITIGKPGIHIFSNALSWDNWQGGPISAPVFSVTHQVNLNLLLTGA